MEENYVIVTLCITKKQVNDATSTTRKLKKEEEGRREAFIRTVSIGDERSSARVSAAVRAARRARRRRPAVSY